MHVIPVLDIQRGVVVRAVGGRRSEYQPLVTPLTTATDPLGVARAIRDHYGLSEFYVADLDAIGGAEPSFNEYRRLSVNGFRVWVDAGIRTVRDFIERGREMQKVIIGSETLTEMPPAVFTPYAVFSQDMRNARPLGLYSVTDAIAAGIRRILLIDLANVGLQAGVGTEALAAQLVHDHPEVEVYVGGGIRNRDDIARLEQFGVAGVLVASMLHRLDTKL